MIVNYVFSVRWFWVIKQDLFCLLRVKYFASFKAVPEIYSML